MLCVCVAVYFLLLHALTVQQRVSQYLGLPWLFVEKMQCMGILEGRRTFCTKVSYLFVLQRTDYWEVEFLYYVSSYSLLAVLGCSGRRLLQ